MSTSVTLSEPDVQRIEDASVAKMIGAPCGEGHPCIDDEAFTNASEVLVTERPIGANAQVFSSGGNVASAGGDREMKTSDDITGLEIGRSEDAGRARMVGARCAGKDYGRGHGASIEGTVVPIGTRPADTTIGRDEARCRAELLAMVTPGVVAVERRIDVSTVIDRFGSKLRVVSALVVTKEDGARLGIVLVPPSRIADRIAWPVKVVRPNDAANGPTMLTVAPVAIMDQAFARPADH